MIPFALLVLQFDFPIPVRQEGISCDVPLCSACRQPSDLLREMQIDF
jgi:hypothetical protein